jgi:hypothetical protein
MPDEHEVVGDWQFDGFKLDLPFSAPIVQPASDGSNQAFVLMRPRKM